jgi:hypothetical protein
MDKNNPLAVLVCGMLFLFILFAALASLSGCAALEPDAVRAYAGHDSHALQHQPFTANPTNYGESDVNLELHWQKGPAFVDLSEGYIFSGSALCDHQMCGGRETFKARVGLELWSK